MGPWGMPSRPFPPCSMSHSLAQVVARGLTCRLQWKTPSMHSLGRTGVVSKEGSFLAPWMEVAAQTWKKQLPRARNLGLQKPREALQLRTSMQ